MIVKNRNSKKINMLLLPPYFFPEQTASTHLDQDRYKAYSRQGIRTLVYVPSPTRGIDNETRMNSNKHEKMFGDTVIVNRFQMIQEGKNPIVRAVRYVLVNIIQYRYGIKAKDIDVVYSGSTPPTQGLLCGLVKKRLSKRYGYKVPYIYNLQDIFPDSLVNANMTKKGSLIWKMGKKIENFTYKSADKIIVINEGFKRNIMEKGVPEEKIIIVPNWVSCDDVYSIERKDNVLFDRYGLDRDKFYITYNGTIGHSQNMDLLLDAAKDLELELKNLCIVIMGEGPAKAHVEKRILVENINNVKVLPFQPYEDIAHVFSLGDVGLIISKPGIGGSSVPSKTWSILAAERPIIASFDEDSELADLIKSVECGFAVQAGNRENLVNAIRKMYCIDRGIMGRKGRKYVVEQLNAKKCTQMYVDTIKSVVEK